MKRSRPNILISEQSLTGDDAIADEAHATGLVHTVSIQARLWFPASREMPNQHVHLARSASTGALPFWPPTPTSMIRHEAGATVEASAAMGCRGALPNSQKRCFKLLLPFLPIQHHVYPHLASAPEIHALSRLTGHWGKALFQVSIFMTAQPETNGFFHGLSPGPRTGI